MYNKSVLSELSKKISEFTSNNNNSKIAEMQVEDSINDNDKRKVTFLMQENKVSPVYCANNIEESELTQQKN
ncbi:hypothetical protein GJ496_010111 [Pomphorhynchus laevis]|nr:hypothetical protein GJ496_010111 [Pomphorhynchus laevis]